MLPFSHVHPLFWATWQHNAASPCSHLASVHLSPTRLAFYSSACREVVLFFTVYNEVASLYNDINAQKMGFTDIEGESGRFL